MQRNEFFVNQVWQKAHCIPGMDPEQFRADEAGGIIKKADYNNKGSLYGWCCDYIQPLWEGGTSELFNVKPLSCLNKMLNIAMLFGDYRCRIAS